jgi:hypothetical protein
MILFESENSEDLELETQTRSEEVSIEICKSVCDGLDEDVDSVVIGYIAKLNMELLVNRGGYLEALEKNLPRCIEAEEYELCARVKTWIGKLKQN